MARLFTRAEAVASGLTYETIRWRVQRGIYLPVARGVYFQADRAPTGFERRLALAMRGGRSVGGPLAAALRGFDGFNAPRDGRYNNIATTSAQETLLAISATATDVLWEQALEWCLRKREVSIVDIENALMTQRYGNGRMRRVLKLRPAGAPPTESLMETMAVQLMRNDASIPVPTRQVEIRNVFGEFRHESIWRFQMRVHSSNSTGNSTRISLSTTPIVRRELLQPRGGWSGVSPGMK